MANIQDKIDKIKNAIFGKEVRGALADGIESINKEVENTTGKQAHLEETFDQLVINSGTSNAEVVDARVDKNSGTTYKKLGDRLDEHSAQMADIKKSKTEWVNIKELGAKGNGVTDDTDVIQNALSNYNRIYFPQGTYLITRKLIMPLNVNIFGDNSQLTIIKSTIKNDYIVQYGDAYDYNGYRGSIKRIRFTSDNIASEKPYGIYLNSGLELEGVDFLRIGKVLDRTLEYIDMIRLDRVYVGYCVPNGEYLINIQGNNDALLINQLKVAKYETDKTQYNGIRVYKCHGGSIKNSIVNFNINIDKCNAFSLENTHIESSDNNSQQIKIIDSNVCIRNSFKFKNFDLPDISLESTDYDKTSSLTIEDTVFYLTNSMTKSYTTLSEEIDIIPNNCTVNIKNCYRQFNHADNNRTTMTTSGILIKSFDKFNQNSSELSQSSIILAKNNIKSEIVMPTYFGSVSLGSIAKTNLINWLETDKPNMYYRALHVVDETRKVIQGYTGFISTTGLINGQQGVSIALNDTNVYANGNLLLLAGEDSTLYNKQCLIPITGRTILLDNGKSVNGYNWTSRTSDNGYSAYNRPIKFHTVNNGENAVIYNTVTPTSGVWKSGDRCVNTNIAVGQIKSWTYNGTAWLSEGVY